MVGPYTTVDLGHGREVDLFLLRFDEDGELLSPQTQELVTSSLTDGYTDVFVFSHGWNNNFKVASEKYLTFIEGYAAQRARLALPVPLDYKPLLIGVMWPSTSFLFPWEKGPTIAADPAADDGEREEMLRLLLAAMAPEARSQLVELIDGADALDRAAATGAAELVLDAVRPASDPEDASEAPSVDEFLEAWGALEGLAPPAPADPNAFGGIGAGEPHADVQAAAGSRLDPRGLLRAATVWMMKDRAGRVGGRGVAPLLERVLEDSEARLHLVGHSFGARVVLSAMATQKAPRKAHSMLLLQPAVNRWCFAHEVIGRGIPGGYRPVLDRVERPIVTTYSRYDKPLHEAFHLAVRGSSLGEPDIAAVGDVERYGALGGYGPKGIDDRVTQKDACAEGTSYDLVGVGGVVAIDGAVEIDGKPAIDGHGDINSKVAWWALHSLTRTNQHG